MGDAVFSSTRPSTPSKSAGHANRCGVDRIVICQGSIVTPWLPALEVLIGGIAVGDDGGGGYAFGYDVLANGMCGAVEGFEEAGDAIALGDEGDDEVLGDGEAITPPADSVEDVSRLAAKDDGHNDQHGR